MPSFHYGRGKGGWASQGMSLFVSFNPQKVHGNLIVYKESRTNDEVEDCVEISDVVTLEGMPVLVGGLRTQWVEKHDAEKECAAEWTTVLFGEKMDMKFNRQKTFRFCPLSRCRTIFHA